MTDDPSRKHDRPFVDLLNEIESLRAENARLHDLLGERADIGDIPSPLSAVRAPAPGPTLFGDDGPSLPRVNARSSSAEKIRLFRALFAGRDDVYATRWSNPRTGKAGWSPAVVGGAANAKRPDREYLPLTDAVIEAHLSGRIHVGLYPLLPDDSCWLLACDFDGSSWPLDARAYQDAAQALGIEAAIERSRSGDGAHVWILFAGRVPPDRAAAPRTMPPHGDHGLPRRCARAIRRSVGVPVVPSACCAGGRKLDGGAAARGRGRSDGPCVPPPVPR